MYKCFCKVNFRTRTAISKIMWFELWQHSILSLLDLGFLEQALVNQEKGSETTKEHSINLLVKCEAKACKK